MPFRVLKHNLCLARYNMRRKETEYGHMFFERRRGAKAPTGYYIKKKTEKSRYKFKKRRKGKGRLRNGITKR
jgi:hypothetical protein